MAAPNLGSQSNSSLKLKREDVHTTETQRSGVGGVLEVFLRRFRNLSFLVFLTPLIVVCCTSLGLAVAPALFWFHFVQAHTQAWPELLRYVALGFAVSSGYLIYGISLLFVIPALNYLIPFRVKPFRGPWHSLETVPWYIHNALCYMMRLTFLDFITPSPLNVLFFRMMGMKIGKGVVINTSHISDPCLITLEDHVTIGGSATLFAHYGQKGFLVIAPVTIGKGTTIGLKASVMGGTTIGAGVIVRPHEVVLPQTNIPDGSTV